MFSHSIEKDKCQDAFHSYKSTNYHQEIDSLRANHASSEKECYSWNVLIILPWAIPTLNCFLFDFKV